MRYHDPENWPLLREALKAMGRADLVGNGKHLVPRYQPAADAGYESARRKNSTPAGAQLSPVTRGRLLTQHTGLPPRPGAPACRAAAQAACARPWLTRSIVPMVAPTGKTGVLRAPLGLEVGHG